MAASTHLFLFSFFFSIITCFADAIVLPVIKDVTTLQYTTHIFMGTTPQVPTKLVVDLGGQYLWVDCASTYASSSHHSIKSGSLQCSMAKSGQTQATRTGIRHKSTCDLHLVNTITGMATSGDLAEDILTIDYTDDGLKTGSSATAHRYLFSCAPTYLLKGLASGAKAMLGLGRSRIALPSQFANNFGFNRKFTICLSSSHGVIVSGTDISKSLIYTPLVSIQGASSEEYFVHVNSIKINGKRLSLNRQAIGAAKISTVVPYTTMERTIYEIFTKAYVRVAASMNMTRAAHVAPFGVCFSSKGVGKTMAGPTMPYIDLVLQSEMVKWRIHGKNSVVQVSDEVMCLGFLDGGLNTRTSIVIGGYQLEDNILECNLGTSVLGFGSSLLMGDTSCSSFRSVSKP